MKKYLVFVGISLLLAGAPTQAQEGEGTEAHGGDPDRELVMRIWRQTVVQFAFYRNVFDDVDPNVLLPAIEHPRHRPVILDSTQDCDGIHDALACFHSGNGSVTVSRPRMRTLSSDEVIRIMVHEALRLIGLDDGYSVSQRLFNLVMVSAFMLPPRRVINLDALEPSGDGYGSGFVPGTSGRDAEAPTPAIPTRPACDGGRWQSFDVGGMGIPCNSRAPHVAWRTAEVAAIRACENSHARACHSVHSYVGRGIFGCNAHYVAVGCVY